MVLVDDVDHVVGDVEDGDAEVAQLLGEVGSQRVSSHPVAPDPHVGDEQSDEGVQITRVERDCVAARPAGVICSWATSHAIGSEPGPVVTDRRGGQATRRRR